MNHIKSGLMSNYVIHSAGKTEIFRDLNQNY